MTPSTLLEAYLNSYQLMPPSEVKEITRYFKFATFQKNQILLAEGDINNKFYFLASG